MEDKILIQIKNDISKAEAGIKILRVDIQKAKAAGINTRDSEKRLTDTTERIRLLKAAYGT